MNLSRRAFLQATASGTALLLVAATGLAPRRAAAAVNPLAPSDHRPQFEATNLDDVVKQLGGGKAQPSADIDLKAPEIAENGAVVPVEIQSKLPGTRLIAIVSEKNPHALSAAFHIPDGTEPYVSTRVKIAETSNLYALVQTDQGFFYANRLVKVTLGGCGG
ncbi:MAG: thiosulfate oxidation carrier protein SoxY [Mizugakiibacter sp.]|uniref:thiosulfate oxidation carrier protein SoxY n=1 Tax=Mizugakiibacter sp. TaxID=1972610 RepID=UPI0031CC31C6|nr:thiosulfate oxidation carrier protein SoxY [Xanthomonadaceae bacterium]